jgi:serine protease Do
MSESDESVWSSFFSEPKFTAPAPSPESYVEPEPAADASWDGRYYSDAHYEPASAATDPTRFYTPPVRMEKPAKKREKRKASLAGMVCLCLICALLSGMLGAGAGYYLADRRLDAVEQSAQENAKAMAENAALISDLGNKQTATPVGQIVSSGGTLPASQIYELACSQVVGITTTVTTNYFGQTSSSAVSGSGFILSEDGYIITNYHVIEYADLGDLPVTVILHDGTEYEASIVGKEDVNDIAVLKIEASGLTPVRVGNSDAILVGDEVYAVGNPLGELEFSMSTGHVSALDRVVSTEEADSINMFQIDAAVNPGNSGGPVYNTRGEVIGVVTAKYKETGVEGLGFAIPINDAVQIAEELVTKGYVTGKAYLGVWLDESYDSVWAQYYEWPLGAFVSQVETGSAAAKAGLRYGDIITHLGDQNVESYKDLKAAIRQYNAGDSAELEFYRDGESRTVTVTFGEKTPESGTLPPVEP